MPDQRTDLTTVLRITNGEQYLRTVQAAAQAHQQLARAQDTQDRSSQRLANTSIHLRARAHMELFPGVSLGERGVLEGAGLMGGIAGAAGIAALGAMGQQLQESIKQALDYERATIRAQVALKNMGNAMPISQLQDLARQQSLATGAGQADLLVTAQRFAYQRQDAQMIERLTRDVAEYARATGTGVEEAGRLFESAHLGQGGKLFEDLGIRVHGASGQLLDYSYILDAIEPKIKSLNEAMAKSPAGAADFRNAAFADLQLAVGQAATSAASGPNRVLGNAMKQAAANIRAAGPFAMLGPIIGPIAAALRGPAPGEAGSAAQAAAGKIAGGSRTEDYLRRIVVNTSPQGPLGRALRGGGAFGEMGGGLHVRDLNTMFSHRS